MAELQYALLPSLSVLGAATGCSVRAQLIALVGMMLAASAGLAELRYALLPSLSMLGAAEAAAGCSVRAQLIALVGMTLAASAGSAELGCRSCDGLIRQAICQASRPALRQAHHPFRTSKLLI